MCFYQVDTVKIEKEMAMLRYRRFKKIGNIVRTLEFCFAVMFFSWSISRSSPYFSAVFQFSSVFLHRFYKLVVSHHFVFLLGNGIVLALLVKFGKFACDNRSTGDDENLIGQVLPPHEMAFFGTLPQETVSDKKEVVLPEIGVSPLPQSRNCLISMREPKVKRCRRSRSHEFDREKTEKIQLRRAETEPRREPANSDEETALITRTFDVDNLSDEEFQRKVEAFIERQQRFLREESLSIITA